MKRLAFLLLAVALVLWYLFSYERQSISLDILTRRAKAPAGLVASGVIREQQVMLSLSKGGRVAHIWVAEGAPVQQGDLLLELDRALYERQVALAQAQVRVAQAALEQAQAGARPGKIAIAQAENDKARASHEAAANTLAALRRVRENPQELDLQIALLEAQIESARYRRQQADNIKNAAEVSKELYEYLSDAFAKWPSYLPAPAMPAALTTSTYDWWKAWVNVNATQESLEGQEAQLAGLREIRRDPQTLNAQIDELQAALLKSAAASEAAQAQLDGYRAGAAANELAVLSAQLGQAQTALDALLAQGANLTLRAPQDGVVLSLTVHEGEVLGAGVVAVLLGDLTDIHMTVYAPESSIGRVRLGQPAQVTVDAWPGEAFAGEVSSIADHPEYTPRNVATQEGRTLTYYSVEIKIANAADKLKPGMPGEAALAD